jgi:hypothetical protein
MPTPISSLCPKYPWCGRQREFAWILVQRLVRDWTLLTNLDRLTDFNVAISIISLFFLLTKLIGFIMNIWYPVLAIFINVSLVALYAVSTYGQIGPDYADPRYPAPAAWYFRFGCGLAKPYGKYSDCQLAQASLGLVLYLLYVTSPPK